jgi:ketosteroid isomerase-like protein
MSQENVEIVRRLFEEFLAGMERGDPSALIDSEAIADDYEFMLAVPLEGRSVWRGREGFAKFMRAWTEDFEGWSVRVERWIDAGDDRVVALTHQSGTGKGSGVPVELNLGVVSELKDGTTPSRSSRAVATRHARRARTVRS